jgi:hypothetical protein
VAITGCKEKTQYKLDVQNSLTKQTEMKNYVFAGNADIDLGGFIPQTKDSNAITANLLGILENSTLAFNGVTSLEPVQLEVDIKAKPAVLAGTELDLPIILKDNKLYLNIPLLSQKDEYFAIDLTKLGASADQKSLLTPDSLKNVSQIASTITNLLFTDMQEEWIKKTPAAINLKDGSKASSYTIDVNEKNKAAISTIFQSTLPKIISTLKQNGILSTEQAEKLNQMNLQTFQVEVPSSLSLTIDEAGLIREQQIKLTFTMKDTAGSTATHHLNLTQAYDQINKNPAFTKEIPKNIKPFEDVLKLLAPK